MLVQEGGVCFPYLFPLSHLQAKEIIDTKKP